MLNLATTRGLDMMQTARMLAMANVAAGDAQIACFDAKYHYWFWRPDTAIPGADTDGNRHTVADPTWQPFGVTPNFPEYPSAHACSSTAVVGALTAFFGTGKITLSLDSRTPALPESARIRTYCRLNDVVKDVDFARVLIGFHFRNSTLAGSSLGRHVNHYITDNFFQPIN